MLELLQDLVEIIEKTSKSFSNSTEKIIRQKNYLKDFQRIHSDLKNQITELKTLDKKNDLEAFKLAYIIARGKTMDLADLLEDYVDFLTDFM